MIEALPALALINARVITMDPACPRSESVAIRGGRIESVGRTDDRQLLEWSGFRILDCRGRTVLPGFIDAHIHLHAFAESLMEPDLGHRSGVDSIEGIRRILREEARKRPFGTWIQCRGYHEFHLREKRHPGRRDLDGAAPDHFVKLTHATGHAHVLNSAALRHLGITIESPDPEGGWIERDLETGEPTGVLFEMGSWLARRVPGIGTAMMEEAAERAGKALLALGITSVQDASSRNDLDRWELFRCWQSAGRFRSRISMMSGIEAFCDGQFEGSLREEGGDRRLNFGGVKIVLTEATGRLHPDIKTLCALVHDVHRRGNRVAIHAVEEGAIEAALEAIEAAQRKIPGKDCRHRIEHCSVCPPELAARIAAAGVLVVTQPPFVYYHGDRYLETVPDNQLPWLYPLKTLQANGVKVAGSSDSPIVPASPLVGIGAAVNRRSERGKAVTAKEAITPQEALALYTIGAAEAGFAEKDTGSIKPGKRADLVVLDEDPLQVPPEKIGGIEVLATVLDGEFFQFGEF
ncbi:MAG: amidohydrolase [Deltaproteobacteria bacterium]|nr:amidohydrolase [Deltaproteobacteria bacterium]